MEECLQDKHFLLPLRAKLIFQRLFQDDSVSTKRRAVSGVRSVGVETGRYCNSHRNVWVRWDVALCSCCSCEIRQGQFHIFTPSTAAGKFYSCWTLWLLLMCQKWIPLGKNCCLLSFLFSFFTKLSFKDENNCDICIYIRKKSDDAQSKYNNLEFCSAKFLWDYVVAKKTTYILKKSSIIV